jgi:hypothetical protein
VSNKDGTIYACGGGGGYYYPPTPTQKIRNIQSEIDRYNNTLERIEIERKIRKDKGKPLGDDNETREIISEIRKRKIQIEELTKEQIQEEIREDKQGIASDEQSIEYNEIEEEIHKRRGNTEKQKWHRKMIDELNKSIEDRKNRIKENEGKLATRRLLVPEGAMEWLLHEVGHWLAASVQERELPHYGFGVIRQGECTCNTNFTECRCGDIREWQAWAFEEIILAPFGQSRNFCPPPHRGGIAFTRTEFPDGCLRYAEQQIRDKRIEIEEWRVVYGEWIKWGTSLSTKAPWMWEAS